MIKTLLLALILMSPFSANAAEKGKLIVPRIINVSLTHPSYMEPEQFGLMMKVPNAMSGCFEVSGLEYETSFIDGNFMDIDVKGFYRTATKTQNVTSGCDLRNKSISAMIPINAMDLKNRGIREIRFKNGQIEDQYKIEVLDNQITLTPERTTAFKANGLSGGKLVHYFDGKGLIALHIPMADKGDDVAQAVRNMAYKIGLIPADNKNQSGAKAKNNVFYFMDQGGTTLDELSDKTYVEIGTIPAPRAYDDGSGAQQIAVPLKVFATKPDTTL